MPEDVRVNRKTGEVRYQTGDGRWIRAESRRNTKTGEVRYRDETGAWRSLGERGPKQSKIVSAGLGFADSATMGQFAELAGAQQRDPVLFGMGPIGMGASLISRNVEKRLPPKRTAEGSGEERRKLPTLTPGIPIPGIDRREMADMVEGVVEDAQKAGMEDNPWSYGGGNLAGYFIPGGGQAKLGKVGLNALSRPLRPLLDDAARLSGRKLTYGGRLLGLGAQGAAGAGIYGSTVQASSEEALQDRDLSLGEHFKEGAELAKDPIAWAGLPALSAGSRLIRRARKGFYEPTTVARRVKDATGRQSTAPLRVEADAILETGLDRFRVPSSSVRALRKVLSGARYSGDDIDRGLVRIANRVKTAPESGDRISLFAVELQKEFPDAAQEIKDVFQQLATAPSYQGASKAAITKGLEDQYGSQTRHFDRAAQARLGSSTVDDELVALKLERGEIGGLRDQLLKLGTSDRRSSPIKRRVGEWAEDLSDDPEVLGTMRAAARELGFRKTADLNEITQAIADNPVAFIQKFGEAAGARMRSGSASPVLGQARKESEALMDTLSKVTARDAAGRFAKGADPSRPGPWSELQGKFRQNYTQEEIISEARGKFGKVRDPVEADSFVRWVRGLPEGDQRVVQTVIRQDMEKMIRGGNITDQGAYLTNLKKTGVSDVLEQLFGEEGKPIVRAIKDLAEERGALDDLNPNKGLQPRVVKGPAADRARNLYTTNPIARIGDKIPSSGYMLDAGLVMSGNLPYVTLAKQGAKMFRPRGKTREGLARLLAMTPEEGAAPRIQGGTPQSVASLSAVPAVISEKSPAPPPPATKEPIPGARRPVASPRDQAAAGRVAEEKSAYNNRLESRRAELAAAERARTAAAEEARIAREERRLSGRVERAKTAEAEAARKTDSERARAARNEKRFAEKREKLKQEGKQRVFEAKASKYDSMVKSGASEDDAWRETGLVKSPLGFHVESSIPPATIWRHVDRIGRVTFSPAENKRVKEKVIDVRDRMFPKSMANESRRRRARELKTARREERRMGAERRPDQLAEYKAKERARKRAAFQNALGNKLVTVGGPLAAIGGAGGYSYRQSEKRAEKNQAHRQAIIDAVYDSDRISNRELMNIINERLDADWYDINEAVQDPQHSEEVMRLVSQILAELESYPAQPSAPSLKPEGVNALAGPR